MPLKVLPVKPTATVYVWYPHNGNIGHVSMFIGDYVECFDPPGGVCYRPDSIELYYNNVNYVSWWPGETDGNSRKTLAIQKMGLSTDITGDASEDAEPHVTYDINRLDVGAMRKCWDDTRRNQKAHYNLHYKNCSDIVLRVLLAGGMKSMLNSIKAAWLLGHNTYVTPKNIAQICNELRDAGCAKKTKSLGCPTKVDNLWSAVGLR